MTSGRRGKSAKGFLALFLLLTLGFRKVYKVLVRIIESFQLAGVGCDSQRLLVDATTELVSPMQTARSRRSVST